MAPSRFPFWLLNLAGWTAFAIAMMLGRAGEWSPTRIVVTESALAGIAGLVTVAMRSAYLHLDVRPDTARPARLAVVCVLVSYVGALTWALSFNVYLRTVVPAVLSAGTGAPATPSYGSSLLDGAVLYTAILLGWSALTLGAQYYVALQRERERALLAEAQAHRARLEALRYQINPHFLFNALNGVSTLVTEGRPREATSMIARLSDFLRLTLEHDGAPEVALADEIDFVRRYLGIEQARFGDRLRVEIDVDPAVLDAAVPALVLQPLVENAVKHAVALSEAGGRVALEARRDRSGLVLRVRDDGPGSGVATATTLSGVGLANVRERLGELYGDAGRVEASEIDARGLCVTVRMPLRLLSPAALPPPKAIASAAPVLR